MLFKINGIGILGGHSICLSQKDTDSMLVPIPNYVFLLHFRLFDKDGEFNATNKSKRTKRQSYEIGKYAENCVNVNKGRQGGKYEIGHGWPSTVVS